MIITRTPLRISFAGGGTDFPDYYRFRKKRGAVVSTTIDKYIYVMVKKRFDDKIVAHYSRLERVDEPDELQHDLIREALKLTEVTRGIEISTTADIPSSGSGLGSSSAVTVGLLHALHVYKGHLPTKEQLANEACTIEIILLGNPIGKQDQYADSYGGLNLITFKSLCGVDEITVERIKIKGETVATLEQNLLLFYTGIPRNSGLILSKQKKNIPAKLSTLDEMVDTARDMEAMLNGSCLECFAAQLRRGWMLKRKMDKSITNPVIQEIYETGIKAGALAGKITGAGGGGFFLFYCPLSRQAKLRKALRRLQELPFNLESQGASVMFNTGP